MLSRLSQILRHGGKEEIKGVNLRRWFIFFIIYLAVLAGMTLGGQRSPGGPAGLGAGGGWLLALYMFYLSLCCTFFPAPTAWVVLLMASPMVELISPQLVGEIFRISSQRAETWAGVATVSVVAVAGAAGSAMANLNEYHIFTYLWRGSWVGKVSQSGWYRQAAHYFERGPFVLLILFSFLPLPVDVVRWLAISRRYRRDYYFFANFLGRLGRYLLLAAPARFFQIGWKGIAAIQLALIGLMLLRYIPKMLSYNKKNEQVSAVEVKEKRPSAALTVQTTEKGTDK